MAEVNNRKRKRISPTSTAPIEEWSTFYEQHLANSSAKDFSVCYYMSGNNVVQADRDHVAQVMNYYARRAKREKCPPVQAVVLRKGVTNNLSAADPIEIIFKAPKHINAMYKHLQESRGDHNNIVVHINIDGSPYFDIV
eukprot:gene19747-14346_t